MDTIWIYLAMVVILGLRWFFEQLKRGAERRRDMLEGGFNREQEDDFDFEPEPVATRPPPVPTSYQQPEPQQQPQQQGVPQTLQELFEQRRAEIAKAQRQVTRPEPVPTPKPEPAAPAPEKRAQVSAATTLVRKPSVIELTSPFSLDADGSSKTINSDSAIIETLSDRKLVRSAIILNEVLGKPKGLDS